MKTKFIVAASVAATIAVSGLPATAKPKVTRKNVYYTLTETTIDGLRKELAHKGPKGYWGYTDWYVRWTGSCKLTVDITYTLPRHRDPGKLDPKTRASLMSMIDALTRHEHGHGAYGIQAATAIEQDGCRNGDAILRKYIAAEKAYDKKTNHGIREGVVLE